jgi:hypothetical protein
LSCFAEQERESIRAFELFATKECEKICSFELFTERGREKANDATKGLVVALIGIIPVFSSVFLFG